MDIGGHPFEMHSPVQLSIRQWLEVQGQFDKWAKEVLDMMGKTIPSDDSKTKTTCQMLRPHLKEGIRFLLVLNRKEELTR
jgi:hypothetical protein